MTKEQTEQKAKIMRNLNLSAAEADALLASDREIDRMKKMGDINSDLTDEQKAVIKKYKDVGVKAKKAPTAYKFLEEKSKKRVDATKAAIIKEIFDFLNNSNGFEVKNAEITNVDRMIHFSIGENSYDLTLIQKRKGK